MDLSTSLNIVQLILSAVLIAVVLMQAKGASIGSVFGGSESTIYRTRRGLEKRLFQFTIVLAAVFLIMTLSSIGMPGLNGFIGEFFILQGTFAAPGLWVFAAVAVIGIVLGAAYMLWLYQRVMFGKLENPLNQGLPDLNLRELLTFAPLVVLAFWIGIYPTFFTKYLDQPVNAIVERVRTDYFKTGRAEVPRPADLVHAVTR